LFDECREDMMPIKFVWDKTYSVGNEMIDSQHRRLFDLGNEMQNIQLSDVARTIMNLYKHTREHFDTEERHMKSLGYPKLQQHRELHNGLITGLNNLIEKPIDTDAGLDGLKKFVYNWIIDHILNHDKKYFEFYQEQMKPILVASSKRSKGRPRKYGKTVTCDA
jgi:hemerythrin